jgi:hypothetical protein
MKGITQFMVSHTPQPSSCSLQESSGVVKSVIQMILSMLFRHDPPIIRFPMQRACVTDAKNTLRVVSHNYGNV